MTITPATLDAATAALTPAGREFMRLVGARAFDFFDDGIVEGSGNWGPNMAAQAASAMSKTARSLGGIMARLASSELGLWSVDVQDNGQGKDEAWWTLTELGAALANAVQLEAPVADDAPADEAPAVVVPGKLKAHAGCSHPATKAARATCRRAAAKADPVVARVVTREAELDDAFDSPEDEAAAAAELIVDTADDVDDALEGIALLEDEDVLSTLDADAYADAVIADLGGQQ